MLCPRSSESRNCSSTPRPHDEIRSLLRHFSLIPGLTAVGNDLDSTIAKNGAGPQPGQAAPRAQQDSKQGHPVLDEQALRTQNSKGADYISLFPETFLQHQALGGSFQKGASSGHQSMSPVPKPQCPILTSQSYCSPLPSSRALIQQHRPRAGSRQRHGTSQVHVSTGAAGRQIVAKHT